jgi:hypothetical protein
MSFVTNEGGFIEGLCRSQSDSGNQIISWLSLMNSVPSIPTSSFTNETILNIPSATEIAQFLSEEYGRIDFPSSRVERFREIS